MAELPAGAVFAGYVIERVLGQGGMGTVYAARHPRLPRRDALKVLPENYSANDEFRARFSREAELAARLDHPNIVAVHDRGVADGRLWIAMQLVDGIDAAELIRRFPNGAPPELALHIIVAAAQGLDEAHRAGLLHRDIKPANILLEARQGEADRVLVADFGIARAAGETTALTAMGSVVATIAYASPEQLMGRPVDQRVDVYALGCTLYELLTGTKPFARPTASAVLQAHIQDPPPRPSMARPGLPPALDGVIARALAKDPQQRYPSCGALAADALAAFGAPGRAPVVAHTPRRRIAVLAGALATIAVLVVAGVVVLNRNSEGSPVAAPSATSSAAPTSAPKASWGSHQYMARAFPGFLPEGPDTSGYQGIRCVAVNLDKVPVDLNAKVDENGDTQLSCNGNRDPVGLVLVVCRVDRKRYPDVPLSPTAVPVGDEPWTRASGSGRVRWANAVTKQGEPFGNLSISFDDPGRYFCRMLVLGGSGGQELFDRWWRDAPI